MAEQQTHDYDDAISDIVRARQRAYREVNAFPQGTSTTADERLRIIADLPDLGSPDAIRLRLGALAHYGLRSLDLARTDNMGDWERGHETDEQIDSFFTELHGYQSLQRELGVVSLTGLIDKNSPEATPEAHPVSLGPEFEDINIYHVMRTRMVGLLALASSGRLITVRKRSDFRLGGAPGMPDELGWQAKLVVRGGWSNNFVVEHVINSNIQQQVFERVRANFAEGIESAIRAQKHPKWLHPINMNHYAMVDD